MTCKHIATLVPIIVQLLVGCGGGEATAELPPIATAIVIARESPLAVPIGVDATATTIRLLDFAEQAYSQYFPGHQTNRTLSGWIYRYYPETGVYIAVVDWRVFILGGPFGPEARDMGEVTAYVAAVPIANPPPRIALSSPAAGTVIAPANISITAAASDPGGGISRVEFYAGTTKLAERTAEPYSFQWDNVPAGSYAVSAIAIDNLGARTTSASVSVTVSPNKAPTVLLTAPLAGSAFTAPATIPLTANPTDDVAIAKVEFFAGALKVAEATRAPFSSTWTGAAAGSYTLTARATDTSGLTSVSNAVSVTVNPAAPTPSPPGTLTAQQLAACPTTSSSATNFYLCMIGGLTGTQVFDKTKVCTFSISIAGLATISSDGSTYSISATGGGRMSYTKASSYLLVFMNTPGSLYPSLNLQLDTEAASGKSFFVDGGTLTVDLSSFDPRPEPSVSKALTCVFDVPKF